MKQQSTNGPRVLFWDVETVMNIVATFRLWGDQYIPHQNVLQEGYIVTASWKWLGDKRVHSVATTDDPKRFAANPHDDFHVIKTLHDVLSSADVIVAHNGDQFDTKVFNARAIAHGLPPLPPVVSVDTKKIAKLKFKFNSNRLDYLGHYLGVGRKIETTPGLWMKILAGTDAERRRAIREMVIYNKQDVLLLEDVFKKLQPYMPQHVNRKLYGGQGACPRCGSNHVQSRGTHKAVSRAYQRFQCQACGGWFRDVKPLAEGKPTTRVL